MLGLVYNKSFLPKSEVGAFRKYIRILGKAGQMCIVQFSGAGQGVGAQPPPPQGIELKKKKL